METKIQIGDATLYLGDCMDILPTLDKVDAVITDPPFGVGNFIQQTGNLRGEKVDWNESAPSAEFFDILKKISTHRVIWGANYFNCFEGHGALIWDKRQTMPDFSKCDIASTSWGVKVEIVQIPWSGFQAKKFTNHPCERPVDIYKWSIQQVPKFPKTICDPFLGSGSCGVAAIQLGCSFIGIEREPKYFDIACQRIEQAAAQGQLFEPDQVKQVQESIF
jgi:site-specific DNA-methyltransferase (adenine-specific)/modification methylase